METLSQIVRYGLTGCGVLEKLWFNMDEFQDRIDGKIDLLLLVLVHKLYV